MPKKSSREEREIARSFKMLRGEPLQPATRASGRQLREEMAALTGDTSTDPDAAADEQDVREQIKVVLDRVASGALPVDEAVGEILTAVEGLGQDDDSDEYEDDEPTDVSESVELTALRREKRATQLLEGFGCRPSSAQIRTVASIQNREERHERAREIARRGRNLR